MTIAHTATTTKPMAKRASDVIATRSGWVADLDCQISPAGRRPSLAAMVTNSGRESAFILRII
jgi:hypothetical protein